MKRFAIILTIASGWVCCIADLHSRNLSKQDEPLNHSSHRVIVKFKEDVPGERVAALRDGLSTNTVQRIHRSNIEVWEIAGYSIQETIELYSNHPEIEYIEPDVIIELVQPHDMQSSLQLGAGEYTGINDPMFHYLWGLHNTGQDPFHGTPGAHIGAKRAWGIITGGDVLIAVFDTGIDYLHEDLADNMWEGLGYNFVSDNYDPMDDNIYGHGTHVAGTIAAVGNNGIGVTGVNWSAKLMAVKVFNSEGRAYTSDIIRGIEYSIQHGVRISNHSWVTPSFSQALYDAFKEAEDAGQLMIVSAGNHGNNVDNRPVYPAGFNLDNIIVVAATDYYDQLTTYSNYGRNYVHVAAPGHRIWSTIPNNNYGYLNGTSMASPHVTGIAALILSRYPDIHYSEIKRRILYTVDVLPSLEGLTISGGRVNAYNALYDTDDTSPATITDLEVLNVRSNSLTIQWTSVGDERMSGGAAWYDIRYSIRGPITEQSFEYAVKDANPPAPNPHGMIETKKIDGLRPSTTYYIAMRTIDRWGNVSGISNYAYATTLGVPELDVSPLVIKKNLMAGYTRSKSIFITNSGEGILEYKVTARNRAASNSSYSGSEIRGPDEFGYSWIDSNMPGGPSFKWDNISFRGTRIILEDNSVTPVSLPFPFHFYGVSHTIMFISPVGLLTFSFSSVPPSGNDRIPSISFPNNLVAPFWSDMDVVDQGKIYYLRDIENRRFIVQYENVTHASYGGSYTFQVVFEKNGTIYFHYLRMNGPVDIASIGIENWSGNVGLQVAYNESYVKDSLTVRISSMPEWITIGQVTGAVQSGASVDLPVVFDASALSEGIYHADLRIMYFADKRSMKVIPVQLVIDKAEVTSQVVLPGDFVLHQNYPNPFNPSTTVRFALPLQSEVTLEIYNILGQRVNTLISGEMFNAGYHDVIWDGRDQWGKSVSSGVYVYRIRAGNFTDSKKNIYMK